MVVIVVKVIVDRVAIVGSPVLLFMRRIGNIIVNSNCTIFPRMAVSFQMRGLMFRNQ